MRLPFFTPQKLKLRPDVYTQINTFKIVDGE